jgi:CRISPR-associated protein Cas6/Cse3/CasE subtype I-E
MHKYKINQSFSNAYENHQALKEMFPGDCKLLWVLKNGYIIAMCDRKAADIADEADFIEYFGDVKYDLSGDSIPFSVRVNPTKKVDKKRIALVGEEVDNYIYRKFTNIGAAVLSLTVKKEKLQVSRKKKQTIYHNSVLVTGFLSVTDKELFIEGLNHGIGTAKGFGFGLVEVPLTLY